MASLLSASSFSSDPIVLLMPGLRAIILREARGMDVKLEWSEDKIVVSSGPNSIGIPCAQLLDAFRDDDYERIERAALAAVRYLRALARNNFARYRAFRAKQRSILIQRRFT